jgi:hypothetical protein
MEDEGHNPRSPASRAEYESSTLHRRETRGQAQAIAHEILTPSYAALRQPYGTWGARCGVWAQVCYNEAGRQCQGNG